MNKPIYSNSLFSSFQTSNGMSYVMCADSRNIELLEKNQLIDNGNGTATCQGVVFKTCSKQVAFGRDPIFPFTGK